MTEPRLAAALIRLNADLRTIEARWALIGGLAVSARAEPRTTRDLDVTVAVADDREAEKTVHRMTSLGYSIDTHLEQEATGRLSTVRLLMPGDHAGILADLLFASSGIEAEVAAEADLYEVIPGLFVPLAKTGHLLALKVLALRPDRPQERPQDFSDIRELLKVADEQEIRRARVALELIARRGFDRKKNLEAELEEQLRQFREQQRRGGT
ncbi:MAG TPA: nucleotidyl transferase AbiEii/AbiGii toxin family protein [Thermoanaerobaculia bacterium]|jgi:hypothetical protein